jgi:ABC-type nitrate/sulfonate/bicarbonate transport system substrate-binding protein
MPETESRRRFLIKASSLALAVVPPVLSAALPGHVSAIRIANAAGGLNLAMATLMRQERFLESMDLAPDMLAVADGSRILGGIIGGSVDASFMSGFGQVFPAIEHGAPLKILAGGAVRPVLALFSARPGVRALKDLEGRTVGTGSIGALVYQLTVTLLKKYGVDPAKIRFVNVGSNADIFRAVSAGTVDAGVGEAALITEATRYGVHPLEHGNMAVELADFTFQGAWTSDHQIQTNRDTLVRALAAYARLYRFVQLPQSRGQFMVARRQTFPGAPESEHMAQWNFIQTYKPFAVDLVLPPERLRYIQELNVGFKVQRAPLPFEKVADMSLARDALKLLN